jgi:small nuclear ribonucleoprotein (snRNP)-like protein
LSNIPDWDQKKDVWAVRVSTVPSPYIKAVADSSELLVKVPAYSISGNTKGQSNVNNLFMSVNKSIDNLLSHNQYVDGVLHSYEPYTNADSLDLMSLLEKSGLMETFAAYMTISSVISSIVADTNTKGLSTEWPGYVNCRDAYPELVPFDASKDLVLVAANEVLSKPARGISTEELSKNEDKAKRIPWLIRSLQWFRV